MSHRLLQTSIFKRTSRAVCSVAGNTKILKQNNYLGIMGRWCWETSIGGATRIHIRIIVGQGSIVLAVSAGGICLNFSGRRLGRG